MATLMKIQHPVIGSNYVSVLIICCSIRSSAHFTEASRDDNCSASGMLRLHVSRDNSSSRPERSPQRVHIDGQARVHLRWLEQVNRSRGTIEPSVRQGGGGDRAAVKVQRAATNGTRTRAGRLHEEIRPQSSTRFMTLTRSFCLHGHERQDNGAYTSEQSFVKRILD